MSNPETTFKFTVKPAEASHIELVHSIFSPENFSYPQHSRYDAQSKGEGVYLLAWHDETPIGGFLVRWSGPSDEEVISRIDVSGSAYLEGGLTLEPYRRKGVATAIIREAERLAKEHGCTHIGMCVDSSDNPDAHSLYTGLGYADWGHGDFKASWKFIDKEGYARVDSAVVTFLQKPL